MHTCTRLTPFHIQTAHIIHNLHNSSLSTITHNTSDTLCPKKHHDMTYLIYLWLPSRISFLKLQLLFFEPHGTAPPFKTELVHYAFYFFLLYIPAPAACSKPTIVISKCICPYYKHSSTSQTSADSHTKKIHLLFTTTLMFGTIF